MARNEFTHLAAFVVYWRLMERKNEALSCYLYKTFLKCYVN